MRDCWSAFMGIIQVNMHEAGTRLAEPAELAQRGKTVIMAKAGKPWLDLLPHRAARKPRRPGRLNEQLRASPDFDDTPRDLIADFEGLPPLAVTDFHAARARLPAPLHPDPLDRMLAAQAQAEGLEPVTADGRFAEYGIRTVDAND